MKQMFYLLIFLISTIATNACVDLTDGSLITQSMLLCSNTYDIPNGIFIKTSNIELDCDTAILRGFNGQGTGIRVENSDNVTIRNCHILTFDQGLLLKNVTNSLVEDNGFLKNRIGIRLLESYENTIRENNDKSHQLAVSAVSSKFNIVMLGNKNIDRAFCEVNACNRLRDMQVCESGDFYCSRRCSPASDSDCGTVENETGAMEEFAQTPIATALVSKEVQSSASVSQNTQIPPSKKRTIPLPIKIIIYVVAYAIGLVIVKKK